jgi:hypothetical protein
MATGTVPAMAPATSWAPTAKVSAGVLAASATALILNHWKLEFSPGDGAAITTLITFVVQYWVPDRK